MTPQERTAELREIMDTLPGKTITAKCQAVAYLLVLKENTVRIWLCADCKKPISVANLSRLKRALCL